MTDESTHEATSDIGAAFDPEDPALITYITAGDPDVEATKEYVRALARGGADVIELGLPFSEPIAEGPTIQAAIRRSLDAGMTPARFLDLVSELDVEVPLVVMTYYNLIYRYGSEEGVEPFVEAAADAGLSGIIVPDIPVEESEPLRAACEKHGLDLIYIVAPTTAGERLESIMAKTSGFAYVQARLGTTGARGDVSEATHEGLARLSGYPIPKAVGFGVSEGEHAAEIVRAGADGVIVGSALVDIVAEQSSAESQNSPTSGDIAEREHSDEQSSSGQPEASASGEVPERLEAKASELKAGTRNGYRQRPSGPEQT